MPEGDTIAYAANRIRPVLEGRVEQRFEIPGVGAPELGDLEEQAGVYKLGPALDVLVRPARPDIALTARRSLEDLQRSCDETAMLCRLVGDVIYSAKLGMTINTVIVVEDDVDPSDVGELVWAVDGRRNARRRLML